MDIIKTLPAELTWESQLEKFAYVAASPDRTISFPITNFPKECKPGEKIYILHDKRIRGYYIIHEFFVNPQGFVCESEGKFWKGKFVVCRGEFTALEEPIPLKGFQGYRYFQKIFSCKE